MAVEDGQTITTGEVLVKIPRAVGGAGDITGGLPRVTELLEARNPSNPAVVSEIDGEVTMGKVKRGNREIIVTSKTGDQKKYLVSLSKQILVQEHDAVRAGTPLSDGSVTPGDILASWVLPLFRSILLTRSRTFTVFRVWLLMISILRLWYVR